MDTNEKNVGVGDPNLTMDEKRRFEYDSRNCLHPEFVNRVLNDLAKSLHDFDRMLAKELGVPQDHLKVMRDEKESRPVAAGSKEFICGIPDPRLRQVYRRRMSATDRRTDWRT